MSYRIEPTDGHFAIRLQGEPENCHALTMAPSDREEELNHGLWLVVVFAVWSGPDRKAIDTALEIGHELGDKVQIGIRPFDRKEELQAWCPEGKIQWVSPIWLVLKDGKSVNEMFGSQSRQKVFEAVVVHL